MLIFQFCLLSWELRKVRSVQLLERREVSVMWLNRARQPTYLHDSKTTKVRLLRGWPRYFWPEAGPVRYVLYETVRPFSRDWNFGRCTSPHAVNSFRTYHSRFSHFPVTSEDGGG
jgi:hypothetical protein